MNDNQFDITMTMNTLDNLLKATDLNDVTSESSGFDDLPAGYYLSEVNSAELTISKNSGNPQVKVVFKVVEDGVTQDEVTQDEYDDKGYAIRKNLPKTTGRLIFKYYPLKDEKTVRTMVSDMTKFEGEVKGEPLLPKEYFKETSLLNEALACLTGSRIYVHITTSTNKEGKTNNWVNLISWKRAAQLDLAE